MFIEYWATVDSLPLVLPGVCVTCAVVSISCGQTSLRMLTPMPPPMLPRHSCGVTSSASLSPLLFTGLLSKMCALCWSWGGDSKEVAQFLAKSELLSRWLVSGEWAVGSAQALLAGGCLEWARIWNTTSGCGWASRGGGGDPFQGISGNDRGFFGK